MSVVLRCGLHHLYAPVALEIEKLPDLFYYILCAEDEVFITDHLDAEPEGIHPEVHLGVRVPEVHGRGEHPGGGAVVAHSQRAPDQARDGIVHAVERINRRAESALLHEPARPTIGMPART